MADRPARPGVLPAVRSQAVAGATAVRAARHAVRGVVPARARPQRRAVRRDAGASRSPSGATRSSAQRPRVAVIYEDSFNYLSKMCLLRMREAALEMIDHAARARRADRGVGIRCHRSSRALPAPRRRRRDPRRRRDHARRSRRSPAGAARSIDDVPGIAYLDDVVRGAAHQRAAVHQVARRAAVPGVGSRRRRSLSRDLARPPRLLLDEHRDDARLPVSLQLVREADLRPALCDAQPGRRSSTRSPGSSSDFAPDHLWIVDDVFGLQAGMGRGVRGARGRAGRARAVPLPDARRPGDAERRAGARRRRLPDGVDGRGVGLAEDPRRDGEGPARRATSARANRLLKAAGIDVGVFLQFGYPGETWDDIEATLQLAREIEPADIGVSVSYPLPGTQVLRARPRRSSGRSRTGSTRATSRRCTRRPTRRRSIAASTASCITSSARASPRDALSALARSPVGHAAGRTLRRAARWIYNRAALALTRRRLRPSRLRGPSCQDRRGDTVVTHRRRASSSTTRARCSTRCRWRWSRIASALDRDEVDVVIIDGRLEAGSGRRGRRRVATARCVSASPCSPARRFTTRSRCQPGGQGGAIRRARSSGAAGIRRCSPPSASTNRPSTSSSPARAKTRSGTSSIG